MPHCLVLLGATLFLSMGASTFAADREEHFEYWSKFAGDWQLQNESLVLKVTRAESGACFVFDTETITFVHGWDPAVGKMRILSFYENGAHGIGHATIENGDMVGESMTTNPDGTTRSATWSITRRSDTQFEFTTGNTRFVFNRQN